MGLNLCDSIRIENLNTIGVQERERGGKKEEV